MKTALIIIVSCLLIIGCAKENKTLPLHLSMVKIAKMQPRDYDLYFDSLGFKWNGMLDNRYSYISKGVDTLGSTGSDLITVVHLNDSSANVSYYTFKDATYLQSINEAKEDGFKPINDDFEKYLSMVNYFSYGKDHTRIVYKKINEPSGTTKYEIALGQKTK